MVRVTFGLDHNFHAQMSNSSLFTLTSTITSIQIIFGLLGYKVMKMNNYFEQYVYGGENKSSVAFALICPGVAFMVFGMFFINFGLTLNNVIDKYSIAYFILMIPYMYVQYKTVEVFFVLKRRFAF